MRESDEGAWVRFDDHEKLLNQDVPIAYEKKLQQFDRLRRYAYQVLAEAHQVLWEVDRIPELGDSRSLIESLEDMLRMIDSGWFLRAHDPQGYSSESATIAKARNALTKAKKESPQPVDL